MDNAVGNMKPVSEEVEDGESVLGDTGGVVGDLDDDRNPVQNEFVGTDWVVV
jgi:hypothetical protein